MNQTKPAATNNRTHFKKVVEDFNEKLGYNFVLPKDTDYSHDYGHPVHEDELVVISAQVDGESDFIYGHHATIKEFGVSLSVSIWREELTLKRLHALMKTDAFKRRAEAIRLMNKLQSDLSDQLQIVRESLLEDTLNESEASDTYDLITAAARRIYRNQ